MKKQTSNQDWSTANRGNKTCTGSVDTYSQNMDRKKNAIGTLSSYKV